MPYSQKNGLKILKFSCFCNDFEKELSTKENSGGDIGKVYEQ